MSRPKILLTDAIHPEGVRLLEEVGDVKTSPSSDHDTLRSEARDAVAIVVRTPLPADIVEHAPSLRVIARHGIGLDFIPMEAASEKRIPVVNAPYANGQSVAEHAVGMMLELSRGFCHLRGNVARGNWKIRGEFMGREIRGKTVGIIGIGNIGKKVAAICHSAFSMNVLSYRANANWPLEEPYIEVVENLQDLLRRADIVTLHLPLTGSTRHLLGAQELASMKPTAILINAARGPVVDEEALIQALRERTIAAAALDVFEQEPLPVDHPLHALDNVLLTPHTAALTEESMYRTSLTVANDVVRILTGKDPDHLANPEIRAERGEL